MVTALFERVVQGRIGKIRATLAGKAREYAGGGDRLHNFKVAARIMGTTPAKALRGMFMKHLVSVFDIIDGGQANTSAMVDEKLGDCINYLILLEAVLREERDALTPISTPWADKSESTEEPIEEATEEATDESESIMEATGELDMQQKRREWRKTMPYA